ncbi:uncharacterized protein LOC144439017 [Glandiceps talaboti]
MHDGGVGAESAVKIFANIFISFIGAGVLGLPYAFKEAGVIEGVLIMTGVGILSVRAMLLIIDSKYKILGEEPPGKLGGNSSVPKERQNKEPYEGNTIEKEQLMNGSSSKEDVEMNGHIPQVDKDVDKKTIREIDYGDVGYHAMGSTGQIMVDTAIIISQIGFCCAYMIFITENLSTFIYELHMYQWLFILLPPLALLTMIRKLHKLAIFSLFADFANVTAYAVVFWFDFEHVSKVPMHPKTMSFAGLPFFLGIAIYCYEGAGMILSLEASVVKEKRNKFRSVFIFAMFIVTTLYIVFGICGYLSFGPETHNIITLNLPSGVFPFIVKSCLCFSLFFTYPVMMFPVVRILEKKFLPDKDGSLLKGNMLRIVMVSITGVVVMAIPNFGTLMALVGASCCTLLAFILPATFHLRLFKGSLSKKEKALDYFLIILGIVGAIIGTQDALIRLFPSLHRKVAVPGSTAAATITDAIKRSIISSTAIPTNMTAS